MRLGESNARIASPGEGAAPLRSDAERAGAK